MRSIAFVACACDLFACLSQRGVPASSWCPCSAAPVESLTATKLRLSISSLQKACLLAVSSAFALLCMHFGPRVAGRLTAVALVWVIGAAPSAFMIWYDLT